MSNIKKSETTIEEFDYSENIPNLFRGLNINQNSNHIEKNDVDSDKLKLIQGEEAKIKHWIWNLSLFLIILYQTIYKK